MLAHLLSIPFPWWLAIALALLGFWIFEASFKLQGKTLVTLSDLQAAVGRLALEVKGNTDKRRIREQLGIFILQGKVIQNKCHDESKPAPNEEAGDWVERIQKYLADHLELSYVARFNNHAGVPMGAVDIASNEHRNLWGGIRFRLHRLDEFIVECSR